MRVGPSVPSSPREFARPLPVAAAALLALNDHVLKGAGLVPGWLTGKLSDVAGLFFFPVLLFALVAAVRPARGAAARVRRAALLAALTATVFTAIKVLPLANAVASAVLGPVVPDPSDLLALPFSGLAVLYLRRPPREPSAASPRVRATVDRALLVLAALASMATSRAPSVTRGYPAWKVTESVRADAGCVTIGAEIVKSGKQGVGVMLTREGLSCEPRIVRARFHAGDVAAAPVAIPPWDRDGTTYLGFFFDNEGLWNAGLRDGMLEVDVETPAGARRLLFRLYHAYDGPRVPVRPPPPPPEAAPSMPVAAPPPEGE